MHQLFQNSIQSIPKNKPALCVTVTLPFFYTPVHCRRRRVGTLATNTDDEDGSSASIDTFCSMYASFPSTLTCFYCLESLAVAVSRPTGELCFLGPLSDHIARNFSRFRFFFIAVHGRAHSRRIRMVSSAIRLAFAPIGEFCCFCLFEVMLTCSAVFAVVFASIRTLCARARIPNVSEMILRLCGSFVRDLALSPGEFWGFQSF